MRGSLLLLAIVTSTIDARVTYKMISKCTTTKLIRITRHNIIPVLKILEKSGPAIQLAKPNNSHCGIAKSKNQR